MTDEDEIENLKRLIKQQPLEEVPFAVSEKIRKKIKEKANDR